MVDPLTDGSSPRSWGTRHPHGRRGEQRLVHPHARGEHQETCTRRRSTCGSSPRSWGTRQVQVVDRPIHRFIPTLVGNTSPSGARDSIAPVHPHARGEHAVPRTTCRMYHGSSPRSWGTRLTPPAMEDAHRFIPTLVGNTSIRCMPSCSAPVHPHARREHSRMAAMSGSSFGSSPRSWGTLSGNVGCDPRRRFIPTLVGKTGGP